MRCIACLSDFSLPLHLLVVTHCFARVTWHTHTLSLFHSHRVFKAQNDKKDGQIEKLLEGLRTAGREMDDLENEYEDVVAHIERLESHEESLAVPPADGPLSELQIPAFLVPGQGGKPDDRLKSKAQDWAQRFQSILSHEQPS